MVGEDSDQQSPVLVCSFGQLMAPKAWLEYSLIKSARAWISDFGSKMNPTLESCIVSTVICKSQRLDKYRNLRKHGVYISLKQIELLNTF